MDILLWFWFLTTAQKYFLPLPAACSLLEFGFWGNFSGLILSYLVESVAERVCFLLHCFFLWQNNSEAFMVIAVRLIGADRRGQFRSYQIKPKTVFLACFFIWTRRFTFSTIKLTRLYFSFLEKMSEECFFLSVRENHSESSDWLWNWKLLWRLWFRW